MKGNKIRFTWRVSYSFFVLLTLTIIPTIIQSILSSSILNISPNRFLNNIYF